MATEGQDPELEHRDECPAQIVEGTAEIQKMIVGRRLLEEYRLPG